MAEEYEINYDDERFRQNEVNKDKALNEVDQTYDKMINESDGHYDKLIKESKDWAEKQSQLQQDQTDFAIEQIEQQKEQAEKDYTKEQSGAYVDWKKQSNEYGADAEKKASTGMTGTGYSESSQVSMYNTYQNRIAVARESYGRAVLNYDNAIKDARLQNNARLAEIAREQLEKQLQLALQAFQYKNDLLKEKTNRKYQVEQDYYNRWRDILDQMNRENSLKEQIRQYNEDRKFEREKFNEQKRQYEESLKEEKRQFDEQMAYNKKKKSGGGGGGGGSKTKTETISNNQQQIQNNDNNKKNQTSERVKKGLVLYEVDKVKRDMTKAFLHAIKK